MYEFRFSDRAALQLLWLVPVLVVLTWWMVKRSRQVLESHIAPKMAAFLMRSVSPGKRKLKIWLQCLTLVFFIFALARPQSGEGRQKAKSEGLEIMLVVDVSNSMMAEDARPSRLELAQRELARFIDSLGGDKVGLVAFAGSAILLSPLTNDKTALKMFIDGLSPEAVTTQGTNFKRALNEAYLALNRGGTESDENQQITRVIVVASDGEENEKGGLEAAQKISEAGVRIFTLGLGTEQGGRIPVRDKRGNLAGYKRDRSGNEVVTRSTGQALQAIAEAGKGSYQHVTFGGDAIRSLKANIDTLQRTQFETMEVSHYDEHYQIFLLFGLILAFIEIALGDRRAEGRIWRGRFEVPQQ